MVLTKFGSFQSQQQQNMESGIHLVFIKYNHIKHVI